MTTPPVAYRRFGQTLARAEQALTATLRSRLAEREVQPETWYAMQVITFFGPPVPRRRLIAELERSRTMTPEAVRALLPRLESEGLLSGGDEVELTEAGTALHQSLRAHIAGPTARLLGGFPAEDIETTVRTLQGITEAAERELAGD